MTTVNGLAVQQIVNPKNGMPEIWLEVKFTVNQGAHGCQTIVVGEKTLPRPVCSPIPETFLKLVSDLPPKYVGQKVFAAYRVVGTTDNFAFNVATDGTHVSFPDSSYQRFNAGCVKYISPTSLGVSSTIDNCAVIGSFIDEGVAPERGPLTFRSGTDVVCAPFQPVMETVPIIEVYKPKVIDPAEPMVANDKGMTFVNLDNDDKDTKYDDTDDVVTGGDDELIKIKLKLPKGVSSGKVTLSDVSGGADIRVWKKNDKSTASAYALGTPLDVAVAAKEFSVLGDFLVKELWVEGVKPHSQQRQTKLKMTYDKSPTQSVEASFTILGIKGLTWLGKGNGYTADGKHNSDTLDKDPLFPVGDRIPDSNRVFPDARAPNFGTALDTVELEVSLSVKPVEDVDVYVKSFDVDDPSWSADIDPNDNGTGGTYAGTTITYTAEQDNRGNVNGKKAGEFKRQDAAGVGTLTFTSNDDKKTIEFRTTLQPGDNFRAVANGDWRFMLQLRNRDQDDDFRVVDPNVARTVIGREVRDASHYASNILTAWRILHVERDSMVAVPTTGDQANLVSGTITSVSGTLTEARTVGLSMNLMTGLRSGQDDSLTMSDTPGGNGRFENGRIWIGNVNGRMTRDLDGNGTQFVQKSAGGGIIIPFEIQRNGHNPVLGNIVGMAAAPGGTRSFSLNITQGVLTPAYNQGTLIVAGVSQIITEVRPNSNPPEVRATVEEILFILHDDDTFVLPELPIMDITIGAFQDAYIDTIADGGLWEGSNKETVPFILNIHPTSLNVESAISQINAIENDGNRRDTFWVAYVLIAYQGAPSGDEDPDSEGSIYLGATPANEPKIGSVIFNEPMIDDVGTLTNLPQHRSHVVAHEIGHQFGISIERQDNTVMGQFGNGAIHFHVEEIAHIRSRIKSPGQ